MEVLFCDLVVYASHDAEPYVSDPFTSLPVLCGLHYTLEKEGTAPGLVDSLTNPWGRSESQRNPGQSRVLTRRGRG